MGYCDPINSLFVSEFVSMICSMNMDKIKLKKITLADIRYENINIDINTFEQMINEKKIKWSVDKTTYGGYPNALIFNCL